MKQIEGTKFLFDEGCGVPEASQEDIARSFLYAMAKLGPGKKPVFMGGPNVAGRILAAEELRAGDGGKYVLVRAATEAETEAPF